MTAEPAPSQRVVTLVRAEHPGWWPDGYWPALVGIEVRMPAVVERGRVLVGYLAAAEETRDTIRLTFSDLEPEPHDDT